MIKLSEVEGLMIDKKKSIEIDDYGSYGNSGDVFSHGCDVGSIDGFNESISKQSNMKIGLDREELSDLMIRKHLEYFGIKADISIKVEANSWIYFMADAIIAHEKSLIKVVKDG